LANDVRIVPAGDAALLLEFEPRIDPAINARALALADAIAARCGTVVRDAVVGYCTLTVYFDPLAVDGAWMEDQLNAALADMDVSPEAGGAVVDVPVCYGGELGPDIADVAKFGGCSEDDVVALHTGQTYRVYMLGFVPGWAYMAEVDPRIAAPRRSMPRTAVPAGSVAIANGQTGVYPAVTPGGWNIIGRTPLKPYDPQREEPFLFRAGDTVRFVAIDRGAFDSL
jgi:KipI family sensor histidine kinase inhibitor